MSYSIVIPVYNEEKSVSKLYQEICDVAASLDEEMEIIFIDDGSTDQSWQIIETIVNQDSRVTGIHFRRNFGKAAALDAGFKRAVNHYVITLDADLQDDPKEIPDFLKLLQSGFEVVSGWKKTRHDPWHKVIPSRFFNAMVSVLTGVQLHDHNCGMKGYLREIFEEITLYGELHRFIPVLAAARGYKVGEKVVQHRPRTFGHSKYGFTRFVKGFLDLLTVKFITGYGQRPQHLLGTIGLIAFGIGGLIMTYLACCWGISRIPFFQWEPYHLSNRPAVIYSAALMLLGGQLLSIGIIAELLLSYHHRSAREYSIKETISQKKSDSTKQE
ncbi:MAG: glycosyltransferase family 2 protein [Planctomycetia bacterium]|nr:glycosyltransferase family 2 protein [Planctomycetia bacterium]